MKCNCAASPQIHMSTYKTPILDEHLGFSQAAHSLPQSPVPAGAAQLPAAPGCHPARGHRPAAPQPPLSSGTGHWGHSGTAATPPAPCQSNCGKTKGHWRTIQSISQKARNPTPRSRNLPCRMERPTHSLVNQVLVLEASWHSSSWWKPTAQTVINFQLKEERAVLSKLVSIT